ncbi:MAG: vitamin K epoxide reductase family protein [Anaerolineales bacterium]|nr:vitamin K epoxide reductase family protein [Anaerolineales bacterium]
MAHRLKKKTPKSIARMIFFWTTLVLSTLGAANAIYLLVLKYSGNTEMCLGSSGCWTVNTSPYSEVGGGIPVSLLGVLAYLAIVAILALESRIRFLSENGPLLVLGMGMTGTIFSSYLTWISATKIEAACPFCLANLVIISLVLIIAVIRLVRQFLNP